MPTDNYLPEVLETTEAERLATGFIFTEGPLWHPEGYWYFVDLHIHVDPEMTVARSHALAHEVKKQLKAEFPRIQDVLVHVEPRREEPVPAGAQKSA